MKTELVDQVVSELKSHGIFMTPKQIKKNIKEVPFNQIPLLINDRPIMYGATIMLASWDKVKFATDSEILKARLKVGI